MLVMILKSYESDQCGRVKERNGGDCCDLRQTTWPDFRETPVSPRGGPSVLSSFGAIWVSWMLLQAVEPLLSWVGASPHLLLRLLGPTPWDYVHASLGFMDVERGGKEGLGGTSGFSEGVRFSPDLVSEL